MRRLHKTRKRTELVKSDDMTPFMSWKDLKKMGHHRETRSGQYPLSSTRLASRIADLKVKICLTSVFRLKDDS